jgi:DNA polymerase III epsilon subunit-like protein
MATIAKRPKAAAGASSRPAQVRRKNLNIDQRKLDRARQLLGVPTETEAVDRALALVLLRQELVEGVRRIAGSGGVDNAFEDDSEA